MKTLIFTITLLVILAIVGAAWFIGQSVRVTNLDDNDELDSRR